MNKIEFDATFGDVTKHIELSSNDYGGGGYQILIDKYYHGIIVLCRRVSSSKQENSSLGNPIYIHLTT